MKKPKPSKTESPTSATNNAISDRAISLTSFSGHGKTFRLKWKLTAAIILFGALVCGIISTVFFTTTRAQLRSDFRQRLQDIVGVGALSIDAVRHDTLVRPDQEGGADYLHIRNTLQQIKANAADIHFVYTMRKNSDGQIVFVVDAETEPGQIAHLGNVYTDASAFLRHHFQTMTGPVAETDFYTDRWGTWLTGYAPIFDHNGNPVGVLGADISAAKIAAYERRLLYIFIAIFGASLFLSILLGLFLGHRLAAPIRELTAHAERIGTGDFSVQVPVRTADELGFLAATFNAMTQKLKNLVSALETEIISREAAEKKYRSIFENAMEGIFQSTFQGRVVTANPEFSRMLGYDSPDEAIQNLTDVSRQLYVHPDQRREIVNRLSAEGRITNYRVEMQKKDGHRIHAELTARVSGDAASGPPLIEGMLKDISEQLAREKAQREQELAIAASQAKSDFLANMSHEIRTPMNAVMGLTHLALKTDLTPKQADYLNKILRSAGTLLRIIDDILDFSKIEAGKLTMEVVPFDLEEIMNSLANVLGFKAEEKGLEILFNLDRAVPFALKGDPLRLQQVLTNLVNNAIKFTENGNILVTVTLDPEDPGDGDTMVRLRFSVADTGIGLDEAAKNRLFKSFSQADDSITRKFGGTGLGLAISKRLVNLMQGRIWVESEPGQGSIFWFTAVFPRQTAPLSRDLTYPPELKGMKILVVDDNATAREIICEILERFSFEVHPCASGPEALTDLKTAQEAGNPFQLVIMDWKMPGMDGIAAARQIQSHPDLAKIPSILMLTAYSRDDIREQAQSAGVDGFLLKPANPSLLFDAVMSACGKHGPAPITALPGKGQLLPELDKIRGARLLVVEDNDINRQVAVELLSAEGFQVDTAENGRIAVDLLAESIKPEPAKPDANGPDANGPDANGKDTRGSDAEAQAANSPSTIQKPAYNAILMDIQMPEMDGHTATQKIRELPAPAGTVPIIAMTAHALQAEKEKCLASGMNAHVSKPIHPEHLFATLVQWIDPAAIPDTRPSSRPSRKKPPEPSLNLENLLPGFDTTAGLERVAGNQSLYLDLLRSFANKYTDAAETLRGHLRNNEPDMAARLAHTMKGMAGNLGAVALHTAARDLESAFANPEATCLKPENPLVAAVCEALDHAISEINLINTHQTPPENRDAKNTNRPSAAPQPDMLLDRLNQIPELVKTDYHQALEDAKNLSEQLHETPYGPLTKEMLQCLESFDETGALERVNTLLNAIKQSGES